MRSGLVTAIFLDVSILALFRQSLIAIISLILASNYYIQTIRLQEEKASLEKPLLITPDTRVQGDSIAELKFIVKNPSRSVDYYYTSGSCIPETPELFAQPPIDKTIKQSDLPQRTDAPLVSRQ